MLKIIDSNNKAVVYWLYLCRIKLDMLKIGLVGAGHLGKIHLKLIKEIESFDFVGFYDVNPEVRATVSKEFDLKAFESFEELLESVDAVDIVTPTLSHFEYAEKALRQSVHVFIEKPVTNTVDEAKKLVELEKEANVVVQVGHVERFNPAFIAAKKHLTYPLFIETHRLAQFNPRGTDVSVILDLMIHDIDIVLSAVQSNVKKINASGVAVVSDTPDIANARLEFDNGCVANLTASRMSLKNMRKSRFFQKNAYLSVDFLEKALEIVQLKDEVDENDMFAMVIDLGENKGKKQIFFEKPTIEPNNAIKEELKAFYNSIINSEPAVVSLSDGFHAVEVAHQIIQKVNESSIILNEQL